MRKLLAALLAVPVLLVVYAATAIPRSVVARAGLVVGLVAALAIVAIGVASPRTSSARPPAPIRPVTSASFTGVLDTDQAPRGPVVIDFSGPMDPASVAAALRVDPATTPVTLGWSADRTRLSVTPSGSWGTGVLYTVTVGTGARSAAGPSLAAPVRESFVTRPPTLGSVTVQGGTRASVPQDATVALAFDHPVDVTALRAAFRIVPDVPGTLTAESGEPSAERFTFVPASPLSPGTTYSVGLAGGAVDIDGAGILLTPLAFRIPDAPSVVRFRPLAKTTDVPLDASVSVRFTRAMDRASTAAAFGVTAGGMRVAGTSSWAEGDTVLVFRPSSAFSTGARVVVTVAAGATSADGIALARPSSAVFTTVRPATRAPKPAARATTTKPTSTATKPSSAATKPSSTAPKVRPIPKPSASVAGSWHAVEVYYLSLMNCTRTGGWVTSSGACSSPGGRHVAPLRLDAGISDRVSRPYAKLMLSAGVCSHFVDGNPGTRLRRVGYDSYRWAENIGCQAGDPYRSALETHLFYQSEKSYGGGHYVNLMNPAYDRVGIGVWVSGGRLRLVIDFYHP